MLGARAVSAAAPAGSPTSGVRAWPQPPTGMGVGSCLEVLFTAPRGHLSEGRQSRHE